MIHTAKPPCFYESSELSSIQLSGGHPRHAFMLRGGSANDRMRDPPCTLYVRQIVRGLHAAYFEFGTP